MEIKKVFKDEDQPGECCWREVNPYPECDGGLEKQSYKWIDFEANIKHFAFPTTPDTQPGEVVEAYLQWQHKRKHYEWENCNDDDRDYLSEFGDSFRQIWVLAIQQEAKEEQPKDFQSRVLDWLIKCFDIEIAKDILERNDRFIEESMELAQSLNYSADRAHALVDYVFNRDKGEPFQEVGGVMVTLAALCSATGLNMASDGETEFARINKPDIIEKIRQKQASKPTGDALPIPSPKADHIADAGGEVTGAYCIDCNRIGVLHCAHPEECGAWKPITESMREYATLKTSELQSRLTEKDKDIDRLKDILKNTEGIMNSIIIGSYEYHELRQLAIGVKKRIGNVLNSKP